MAATHYKWRNKRRKLDPEYRAAESRQRIERERKRRQDPAYVEAVNKRRREAYHLKKEAGQLRNRKKARKKNLALRLRRYGLTEPEFRSLLKEQENACAICKGPFKGYRTIHTDHDHSTGKVRGLLCNNCNVGLGLFLDQPKLLKRAIEYLYRGTSFGSSR